MSLRALSAIQAVGQAAAIRRKRSARVVLLCTVLPLSAAVASDNHSPRQVKTGYFSDEVQALAKKIIGQEVSLAELATLVPPNPSGEEIMVTIEPPPSPLRVDTQLIGDALRLTVSGHKQLDRLKTTLYRDPHDEALCLHLDQIFLSPELRRRGIGTELFAQILKASRSLGVKRITAYAAARAFVPSEQKTLQCSGYYTFPRWGFQTRDWPLQATMQTPQGRELWRKRRQGVHVYFPTDSNSQSSKAFESYLQSRRERTGRSRRGSHQ